ncbi:hypothetical protein T492DRAFT_1047971 [Pavlovales sp. CCMP2436]|nr:hypothetical protein T492DRAFT_1047971 [Pavlovales sp. CCMP2436]
MRLCRPVQRARPLLHLVQVEVHAHARQQAAVHVRFPGCGYRAKEACALVVHTRTHDGTKPFPCNFLGCGYVGAQR